MLKGLCFATCRPNYPKTRTKGAAPTAYTGVESFPKALKHGWLEEEQEDSSTELLNVCNIFILR